jgi:hypothetical protein
MQLGIEQRQKTQQRLRCTITAAEPSFTVDGRRRATAISPPGNRSHKVAGVDVDALRTRFEAHLDAIGAKYPAEHNVGHLYRAEDDLRDFYQELDPTNGFNAGVGQTSKKSHYA